ncbi:MAG: Gfo/Idh/MocA family protein, partial [Pseudobdellovibrionaceae bacterium]
MSRGSKLRAAVIGVGYLGNFHAQKYSHLSKDKNFADKVELVGVCDPKFEQAQKVAKELGTRAYASPKELLKEVDLVTIASTTSTHYEVAKMFLENGVHVNVEKPMTVSAIEAENLVSIAKDKRLKLAVGHVERFNPAWLLVKPDLSQVTYAEFTRHATFKSRGADVSVIEDVMIHDLDLVLHLSQNAILSSIKVSGTKYLTGNWDFVTADLTFGSNFRATVSAARVASEMNR